MIQLLGQGLEDIVVLDLARVKVISGNKIEGYDRIPHAPPPAQTGQSPGTDSSTEI